MSKIGRPFSRDVEFTGSCDVAINNQGRLMDNLRSKGFEVSQPGQGGLSRGGQEMIRGSQIQFPGVKGYMVGVEEKTAVVQLNDDQKKKIQEVLGWTPSKVEVSVTSTERSQDVSLTKDQQKSIDDALGIRVASLNVSRAPIEITLK
jgi:hypothetical protein